jgi:hypothetical protein
LRGRAAEAQRIGSRTGTGSASQGRTAVHRGVPRPGQASPVPRRHLDNTAGPRQLRGPA